MKKRGMKKHRKGPNFWRQNLAPELRCFLTANRIAICEQNGIWIRYYHRWMFNWKPQRLGAWKWAIRPKSMLVQNEIHTRIFLNVKRPNIVCWFWYCLQCIPTTLFINYALSDFLHLNFIYFHLYLSSYAIKCSLKMIVPPCIDFKT